MPHELDNDESKEAHRRKGAQTSNKDERHRRQKSWKESWSEAMKSGGGMIIGGSILTWFYKPKKPPTDLR